MSMNDTVVHGTLSLQWNIRKSGAKMPKSPGAEKPLPSHEDCFRPTTEKGEPFADTHTDTDTFFQSTLSRLQREGKPS
jgi:hypothetical protein